MSLPNPSMNFTPFDPLPASDLNDIVENVEALAAGTGLDDSSIVKAKLEKPHRSGLLWSLDTGTVFSNTQIRCQYDTVYSGEYGLVATTGASAKITVARDGLYNITMHFKCIDVSASGFITWLWIDRGGTKFSMRRVAQAIPDEEGWTWNFQLPLLAGDYVYQEIYNGGGITRFGANAAGAGNIETNRILGMSLMVSEIR